MQFDLFDQGADSQPGGRQTDLEMMIEEKPVYLTRARIGCAPHFGEGFIEELIGTGMMTGSFSKVIGTTLLIWDRDKGDAT